VMRSVFVQEEGFRQVAVKGVVPFYRTIRDEYTLSKGGAEQDIVDKREGEKETYIRKDK
jgi:hypothetical protein